MDVFITTLYTLASRCEYGALHDEMIRDRIVVGISNPALSEKMQLDDKLTLEKASKLARESEAVKKQQPHMQETGDSRDIDWARKQPSKGSYKNNSKKPGQQRGKPQEMGLSKLPSHHFVQDVGKTILLENTFALPE